VVVSLPTGRSTAVALIGVKRAASEPFNLGGKLVSGVKFLEGVKGRRAGAMLRAACILRGVNGM
jgi:hypothetical protein